ncbi:hypothetical protein P8452_47359 [Trifolium repens]|nr:hypothetical protein P8452_47359 [Trifolium repens]
MANAAIVIGFDDFIADAFVRIELLPHVCMLYSMFSPFLTPRTSSKFVISIEEMLQKHFTTLFCVEGLVLFGVLLLFAGLEQNHGAGHAHLESVLIELGLARGFLGGERVFGFILSNLTRCKVSVVLGGKQ